MKKITLIVSVFVLLFLSGDVLGCVCFFMENPTAESIKLERQKDFSEATAVFSGEVVKLNDFEAELKVDKIWKGDSADYVTMLTGTTDNGNGTYSSSSCDYTYKLGEKYLIYAYGKSKKLKTHSCSRSRLMVNSVEEILGLEEIIPHKKMNKLL